MAYIGRGVEQLSEVTNLDVITFSDSAGPYNLREAGASFVPPNAASLVISIDGVIQSPNSFTISADTVTFDSTIAATSTNNFIYCLATGLITVPGAGTVDTSKLANSAITINGTSVSLGGSISDVGAETYPTVTSVTPNVITNAQTTVTVAGTNFVSVPVVEAINSSGAITSADTVTYTSATAVDAKFTLAVDGSYYIRVENNSGLATDLAPPPA